MAEGQMSALQYWMTPSSFCLDRDDLDWTGTGLGGCAGPPLWSEQRSDEVGEGRLID